MLFVIKVGRLLLDFIYMFVKLFSTRRKVTMISRQSNEPSFEFEMIKKEILKCDETIDVVLLCHTLDGGVNSSLKDKIRYIIHMAVQMYHIATSKVLILDTYCILASLLHHKKELKIIQMWHSMGTMKKFGYTTLDTKEGSKKELADAMRMHKNYDYVFASAEVYKDHLAQGFNCSREKIITMPLPRLDLLQSTDYKEEIRKKIYKKYPKLQEKPVILYCPTFRKNEERFAEAVYRLQKAVDKEKYHLVVKLHPLSKVELDDSVIKAQEISSFEMLFAADYVISDYSCIVYEAAVMQIPLYFYNFDYDLYQTSRGLAIDYDHELPGVTSPDEQVIINALESGVYDMEELKCFSEKYVHPTKNATKDIVNFIWPLLGE